MKVLGCLGFERVVGWHPSNGEVPGWATLEGALTAALVWAEMGIDTDASALNVTAAMSRMNPHAMVRLNKLCVFQHAWYDHLVALPCTHW